MNVLRGKTNFRKQCQRHRVDAADAPPIFPHRPWLLRGDGGGWSYPAAEHKDRRPRTDGIAGYGDASHSQAGTRKEHRGGKEESADGLQVRTEFWKERRRNKRSVMMLVRDGFSPTSHLLGGKKSGRGVKKLPSLCLFDMISCLSFHTNDTVIHPPFLLLLPPSQHY